MTESLDNKYLDKDNLKNDEKESIIDKNKELLDHIEWLCNRWDREDVEKILLFGTVGAGKSSVVNTIIKALCGTYIPKARVGRGSTKSKTFTLVRYKSCGISEDDLGETERQYIDEYTVARLPTIFDMAGKDNTDSEELEEILELLIGGHVQPGTSIETMTKQQEEHGVGSLRETIYKKSRREWKMTKIVFVHSCRQGEIPDKLINCLLRILRKTDPRTAQPKYSADVYILLTKYDLVKGENSYRWSSNEPTVTNEEFQKVEKEIEQMFSIEGSLEDNRMRWVSYTDATGKDNPYIDNIALMFIRRMLMPRNCETESVKPVFTTWTRMELKIKKMWKDFNNGELKISMKTCAVTVTVAIIALAFLCYVYVSLMSPPSSR